MSSRRKIRRIEDVFKTCLEDALKMSWRRLQDQQMFAGMGSDTPQIYYNLVKNAISFSFRHDIILINTFFCRKITIGITISVN